MRLSDIQPFPVLSDLLIEAGLDNVIYEGSTPTSAIPDAYVQLMQNGSYKTPASQMGVTGGVILISINVKLFGTGEINTVEENLILEKFDSLFENNKSVVSGSYHFKLDPTNLVFSGRGITSGYSTKIINVLVTIY